MGAKANEVKAQPSGPVLRFAPLGIPAEIIADDSTLLDAAVANFADLAGCPGRERPTVSIRLHWNGLATAKVGFAVSVKGSCLTLEGEGILGRADAASRTAECSLSRAYGADRAALAEIGETLLLFLVTHAGRVPLHAAAVMVNETALLLAGPSGSGKSSLALAAQRHGLEVLSEDTSYVQLKPHTKVWGWPGAIHLDAADAPAGEFQRRTRGGRIKSAIPRKLTRAAAGRAILVALEPGDELRLERASTEWLLARLSPLEPGFSLFGREIVEVLRMFAEEGAWRLMLGGNPDEAIALLQGRF